RNIEACLQSVTWADEILVVDSFSTDTTLEIARRYTDRILRHEYVYSAAQKNWAIPKASNEWVLVVDADERVTPGLRQEIADLLEQGPSFDGYWIPRRNFLFGREIRHSGWGSDSVLRLFKRDVGRYRDKRVHAEVEISPAGRLRHHLEHHSVPSLADWVAKINRYSTWKARDKHEKGMAAPLVHLVVRPPARFLKDFVLRRGFMDGWRGFVIASLSAFAELVMAAKVMELRMEESERNPGSGKPG
ncbi:MAG TPA: glycosyltransferase family 2 protein, partial [Deltaproteobacteria bacterium]|nr:glycosyltransferase family 2 protein [Deltaproteobacteria bacterium]